VFPMNLNEHRCFWVKINTLVFEKKRSNNIFIIFVLCVHGHEIPFCISSTLISHIFKHLGA
jgi:hypothetical protein